MNIKNLRAYERICLYDRIYFKISLFSFYSAVYKRLGGGSLKSSIPHPYIKGEKLFLIMDPTHNLKNIYNNWQRKGTFTVPNGFETIITGTTAEFSHIRRLYEREECKSLKIAHRLQKNALMPSNIQRTSPTLALCKFYD